MEFKDLKFEERSQGGWGSTTVIGNHVLSVQCGLFPYSSPRECLSSPKKYESFEIGIWKNDSSKEWVTKQFTDTTDPMVAGWVKIEEISNIITKLLNDE